VPEPWVAGHPMARAIDNNRPKLGTTLLGDDCPSSVLAVQYVWQVRLGRPSVQHGAVRCRKVWWNDRKNDHLSKQ
jgi:hypothetical protein